MMRHFIILLLLQKTCEVLSPYGDSHIIQDRGVRTVKARETETLSCSCRNQSASFFSWYKQSLGGKPRIISSRMKHSTHAEIPTEYRKRFQVVAPTQESTNNLVISDLEPSDSGTYYCGIFVMHAIEFGQGVFLHVQTSLQSPPSVVHQPAMELLRLGSFVNLSCVVYAEQCEEEQNFYWFRDGVSQSAVTHPSGKHCTSLSSRKPNWTNCTLSLELKSLSSSDVGTYYCVLVSCGQTTFGNGIKVEIVGSSSLVFCLSLLLVVSLIVLLVLFVLTYKMKSKLHFASKKASSESAASNCGQGHDADSLHCAAASFRRSSERHHREDTGDVCVYSRVKSGNV
ncbi:putative LOC107372329-like protein [Nothobranchius furzeri]|uniref:LOC107372329-like protein n=1 Tax=Nothobranchius furzeri TaxID=105023 RepID=A0A9D2XWJ9_NOTFU|nr:putative LOC107372329-like protein [Nothobranchius furzeri]